MEWPSKLPGTKVVMNQPKIILLFILLFCFAFPDAFRKMTPDTVCKEANPIEKRALEVQKRDDERVTLQHLNGWNVDSDD